MSFAAGANCERPAPNSFDKTEDYFVSRIQYSRAADPLYLSDEKQRCSDLFFLVNGNCINTNHSIKL
jgi:hypothetical protein